MYIITLPFVKKRFKFVIVIFSGLGFGNSTGMKDMNSRTAFVEIRIRLPHYLQQTIRKSKCYYNIIMVLYSES